MGRPPRRNEEAMKAGACLERLPFERPEIPVRLLHARRIQSRPFPLMYHPAAEIQFFKYGRGSFLIGNRNYPFKPHTVLTIRPKLAHSFNANPDSVYEKYVLQFLPVLAGHWLQRVPPCVYVTDIEASVIEFALQRIGEELKKRERRWTEMVRLKLQEILYLLERVGARPNRVAPSSPLIGQITDYIDRHLADGLKVSSLSARSGYSSGHLTRLFRRCTGLSLKQYLVQRQMFEAKRLLVEQAAMKVDAVAGAVGFSDFGLFNKAFKTLVGCTATEYRRNYQVDFIN